MKKFTLQQLAFLIAGFIVFSILATGCKKDSTAPDIHTVDSTHIHKVDPKLVGKWMWTEGSDEAHYDDDGVYTGAAYGLALEYTINADGSGTSFNHLYSSLDGGTGIEVNISSKGFFESDDKGHLGYFPTSGTYKSTSGENRALRPDELWNATANTGKSFLYQKLVFTTQGTRACYQVTATDGTVDTYFKMP